MLDLSKVYAYGQFITNSLWNEFRALLEAKFNAGITSSDIAAGGVSLANLANQKSILSVLGSIKEPGTGHGWAIETQYTGYSHVFASFKAPADMVITEVWLQTQTSNGNGEFKLMIGPNGGPYAVVDATHMYSDRLPPWTLGENLVSGLSVAVAAGEIVGWGCDDVSTWADLPVDVGFSALVAHQP